MKIGDHSQRKIGETRSFMTPHYSRLQETKSKKTEETNNFPASLEMYELLTITWSSLKSHQMIRAVIIVPHQAHTVTRPK